MPIARKLNMKSKMQNKMSNLRIIVEVVKS